MPMPAKMYGMVETKPIVRFVRPCALSICGECEQRPLELTAQAARVGQLDGCSHVVEDRIHHHRDVVSFVIVGTDADAASALKSIETDRAHALRTGFLRARKGGKAKQENDKQQAMA